MAGFMDANQQFMIRTNVWSRQIKELLLDELNAMKFVRIISDFPDGYIVNIPSIGEAETADFTEGQAIRYNSSILPTLSLKSSRGIRTTAQT
jgi:hypothetical protein